MFNEDFLIWCKELQFKEEHMELPSPLDIINEKEEYKVKEVQNHQKWECSIQFLIY